ncbi:hypothetical protein [Pseudomonas sp. Irchel 3E13]|uniref:hypothetical protein n=1 Tax=Pseudomonas sp. Irchel 3E13 TaxID=2008975 RepID=UPI000BA30EEE|nr:hypothetical protein [Pseudomonas sp. Irchel 3E13]
MIQKRLFTVFGGALLLAGCSNKNIHQDMHEFKQADPVSGLQVAIGKCISFTPLTDQKSNDEQTRSFLAAAAAGAISQGVNLLGKALTKAGESKTWSIRGSRNFESMASDFPQCVQVVRGRFNTRGPADEHWALPLGSNWPADTKSRLDESGLYLAGVPEFLFEGRIVLSEDSKAFTIRPVVANYIAPIDTRFLRPSKVRTSALFFAITPPGTNPTLEDNPAAAVSLGTLEPGMTRLYKLDIPNSSPYESPWSTLSSEDTTVPLTITVLLTESQNEQEFLAFMGAVLSDPDVAAAATTEVSNRLIPSARKAAKQVAEDKESELIAAREAAYPTIRKNLAACVSAAEPESMREAANNAKAAMLAYYKADRGTKEKTNKFSPETIDGFRTDGNPNTLKKACDDKLSELQ